MLDARVLELDDELKEAYNKFDNAKSELVITSVRYISFCKSCYYAYFINGKA